MLLNERRIDRRKNKMGSLEEKLGAKGTLIMGNDDRRDYSFARKLSPDPVLMEAQVKGLRQVIIHNAYHTEEILRVLARANITALQFVPQNSAETHLYVPESGTLHVINPRGVIRLKRDEGLIYALEDALGRELRILVDHYTDEERAPDRFQQNTGYVGDPSRASHRFEHLAFKTNVDAGEFLDRALIAEKRRLNVVMGPHGSLPLDNVTVIGSGKTAKEGLWVGINNQKNAAIAAVQILGKDREILEYRKELRK